ncbi:hypothetical protein [Hymenobacter sp. BT730]|uniref:hypothetical protein n=1 Tax=Hymenobacter sp. BT730 TaxID=3063332 RepID=UPI0026E02F4D|nr:hypothetical protein [Hymenobacter sp. BT730]
MFRPFFCTCLLLISWLGLFITATAQIPAAPTVTVAPVDTVQVLHELFAAKRKTGRKLLLLEPVALGLMVASFGGLLNAALDGSGQSSAGLSGAGMLVGLGALVGLPMQLIRNSAGREQEVITNFQRKHRLPTSVRRSLEKRLAQPGS